MKRLNLIKYFVFLFILSQSVCFAYDGPEEGGFFPIGWSEKGDVFAYGYYIGSTVSQDISLMVITIQNMVTDSVLFMHAKEWQQTCRGDDLDVYLPSSAKHAWSQIPDSVKNKLDYYRIKEGTNALHRFYNTESFNAIVLTLDQEPGYGLYIGLPDGKQKIITTFREFDINNIDNMVVGYVWDPKRIRMAVIIYFEPVPEVEYYATYSAFGCHTKFGFKHMGR